MPPLVMSVPVLALLLAVQAQNPTSIKERPIPEGMQWFNAGPVRYRDVELRVQAVESGVLKSDLPVVGEFRTTPFMTEYSTLEFGDIEHEGFTVGVSWDFNLFRLAADFFVGDWEGPGTLRYSTGMQPETVVPLDLEGDSMGLRVGAEWPVMRYLDPSFEIDLGPVVGVNWYQQQFESPSQSPFPFTDDVQNELVGSIGLRLGVRVSLGKGAFVAVEGEIDRLFGVLEGTEQRVAVAVGYRF
jgi:hypothetical protein